MFKLEGMQKSYLYISNHVYSFLTKVVYRMLYFAQYSLVNETGPPHKHTKTRLIFMTLQ